MRCATAFAVLACACAYTGYEGTNCYNGHGAANIDSGSTALTGLTVESCEALCDDDASCGCVTFRPSDGKCWRRSFCTVSQCDSEGDYDTYVKSHGYTEYIGKNCYEGNGGHNLEPWNDAPTGLTVEACEARCDADAECACATFGLSDGRCLKRTACVPDGFESNAHYTTYAKIGWAPPSDIPGMLGNRVLVDQFVRGAACLDGSAPGYWIRTATVDSDSNRWVLHAEGGGWCYDEGSCAARAELLVGSSKNWGSFTSCYGQCDGILSDDAFENPDFYGWNAVWIGYCDGTSMSGNLDGTHEGLHFRGRANLDAVLDSLFERGLDKASDVVFTGGSAGGLAVFFGVDHVAARVHEHSLDARVVGLPDAGFFLDHAPFGQGTWSYTDSMKYLFKMSAANTDADCLAELGSTADAWKCFMAQYVQPYVQTPLFITEGMYDSWQLNNILQLGCGSPTPQQTCDAEQLQAFFEYGQRMNESLAAAVGAGRGAFISACIVHCQTVFNTGGGRWSGWKVDGVSLSEAFGNFYFGRSGHSQLIDAAPYPSNPSCQGWNLHNPAGIARNDLRMSLV